jgi:hypothetical protein
MLSLWFVIYSHLNSAALAPMPVWARDFASSEELITEFCRECRIVRKGEKFHSLTRLPWMLLAVGVIV